MVGFEKDGFCGAKLRICMCGVSWGYFTGEIEKGDSGELGLGRGQGLWAVPGSSCSLRLAVLA